MLIESRLPWPLVFQVLGVIAAVWLVAHTWPLWILAFVALIVAAAILPAARFGARYHVPRAVTVLVVYVAILGVFTLMGVLLWPALSTEWRQLMEQLPELLEEGKRWIGNLDALASRWGTTLPTPETANLPGVARTFIVNALRVTAGVLGGIIGVLAVVVISAYIVIDAERLGRGVATLLPERVRPRVQALAPPVMNVMGAYVRGQLVVSACVGLILAGGLWLLGVRYSLLIGALAAVLNVVPFVGSFLASILGVLSALHESLGLAVATALLFWGTNVVEGKLLVPQLVGRATGLHPLAVLFALLMGAHLAGLIGALVAVPLLAAAEVVRDAVARQAEREES